MNVYEDLERAIRRLGDLEEQRRGHGGHRTQHAPTACRYCREWVLAVLDVRKAATVCYGPDSVAARLKTILEEQS